MRLNELAVVKTGLVTARKKAKQPIDKVAEYRLISLKAVNDNGYIEDSYLETFPSIERLKAEYLTQSGDVLVRLTTPYTAVLINEVQSGWIIPSHFIVIRSSGLKILPEYLYWLLNTERIKADVQQNVSSTVIGNVKPKAYADMDIELLPLRQQKQIADIYMTAQKELRLLVQLKEQKEIYYKEAINKIQKEMRK